jgi:hypothetical protein
MEAMQILTAYGHSFTWHSAASYAKSDGTYIKWAGFDYVGGKKCNESPAAVKLAEMPQHNVRRESLVEVRRDRVTGYIDGQKMVDWKTDYSDMSKDPSASLPDAKRLGIGIWGNSKTTFHDISVREVTGKGKLLRETAGLVPAGPSATKGAAPK